MNRGFGRRSLVLAFATSVETEVGRFRIGRLLESPSPAKEPSVSGLQREDCGGNRFSDSGEASSKLEVRQIRISVSSL